MKINNDKKPEINKDKVVSEIIELFIQLSHDEKLKFIERLNHIAAEEEEEEGNEL